MAEDIYNTHLLIGILVDVSGSMRASIGNSGKSVITRLESFSAALQDMVMEAASTLQEDFRRNRAREVRIFAYGFGFGNPISAFIGRRGPNVRDLFAPRGVGERTLDVLDLADNWQQHYSNVRSLAIDMFGDTPMRAAFERAKRRLIDETTKIPATSVLFVLSDGEPSDGDSDTILAIAAEIRSLRTTIVSCFVTDTDITEPRRLYDQCLSAWPQGARLMFDCASELQAETTFDAQLREYGWRIAPNSHLFSQVNQSEMLSEFLNVALSPLREVRVTETARSESAITTLPEKHNTSDWYVSYAWGDNSTPEGCEREEIVAKLCDTAASRGRKILRDKDVLGVGDSISAFMQRIGAGARIFVILSEKYLRSSYCMFELSEVWRTSRQEGKAFLARVRIYALPDAKIFNPGDWADCAIYWKQEYDPLEARARTHGMFVLGELGNKRLMQMRTFYNEVPDILGTLADIVQPRTIQDFQRYGFDDKPEGAEHG